MGNGEIHLSTNEIPLLPAPAPQARNTQDNDLEILWLRGYDKIRWSSPNIFLTLGRRGAGKSVLLEVIGEHYLSRGHKILDLFGAASGEGLAWLRSPWVQDRSVLLIKGQKSDLQCSWHCLSWDQLTLKDLERHDIIISASPFYFRTREHNEEFLASDKILDLLMSRQVWHNHFYLIAREASKLLFSRKKKYEDQLAAKQGAVYLLQESRHFGLALGMDAQKVTTIDSDIRSLCDYRIFKSQGSYILPRELWFIYRYLKPGWVQSMPQDSFGILAQNGAIGIGHNKIPPWHKRASEDILKAVGITVGDGIAAPTNFKVRDIIRDGEHSEIIRKYQASTSGVQDVANQIQRSTFVVYREITKHNNSVAALQYCPICLNGNGEFSRILLVKKKRGRKSNNNDT